MTPFTLENAHIDQPLGKALHTILKDRFLHHDVDPVHVWKFQALAAQLLRAADRLNTRDTQRLTVFFNTVHHVMGEDFSEYYPWEDTLLQNIMQDSLTAVLHDGVEQFVAYAEIVVLRPLEILRDQPHQARQHLDIYCTKSRHVGEFY